MQVVKATSFFPVLTTTKLTECRNFYINTDKSENLFLILSNEDELVSSLCCEMTSLMEKSWEIASESGTIAWEEQVTKIRAMVR